ncbi:MAG: phosphoribosylformylglycinamidine cyclo-ligase [Nitrospirota bacterium]
MIAQAKSHDVTSYADAGVDTGKEEQSIRSLLKWLNKTISLSDHPVKLDFGYFANVISIGDNLGLAISTDGVGTKIIVAQMMDKYDTIGIDCIAMNVNDVLCVGAKPISMVDYIAVQKIDNRLLEEIGKGLLKGAEISRISIPAGEIAQIREMLKSEKEGFGFDLVGTAIGTVPLDRIIVGEDIQEGDALIGLRSNGIHSNGLTLARRILFEKGKYKINNYINELGKTIGEELLEPTHIYVPEIIEMINLKLKIKALVHITSDGFLNLNRVKAKCGYIIENLPEPHPIFNLIQQVGNITDKEMFTVYNMGIGFCVVVPDSEAKEVFRICKKYNVECYQLGYTTKDSEKKVFIKDKNLIGKNTQFYKA